MTTTDPAQVTTDPAHCPQVTTRTLRRVLLMVYHVSTTNSVLTMSKSTLGEAEVWQSNRLVEASQTMTLNEKRLVIAAAALHDPRKPLPPRGTVTLHADDFAGAFGIDTRGGQVYAALRDAAERLFNRRVRTITEGKRGRKITDVRWVWMASYNEGEGSVTLGFSPLVAPYLTMLFTEFTRFKLRQIGAIGSFYGIRLYELMAQYRSIGKRSISLEQMREMLALDDKYPRVDSLCQRVLDPAIAEINKHTDLRVVMTAQRQGRKVIGFNFQISVDAQLSLDLPQPKEEIQEEGKLT